LHLKGSMLRCGLAYSQASRAIRINRLDALRQAWLQPDSFSFRSTKAPPYR